MAAICGLLEAIIYVGLEDRVCEGARWGLLQKY